MVQGWKNREPWRSYLPCDASCYDSVSRVKRVRTSLRTKCPAPLSDGPCAGQTVEPTAEPSNRCAYTTRRVVPLCVQRITGIVARLGLASANHFQLLCWGGKPPGHTPSELQVRLSRLGESCHYASRESQALSHVSGWRRRIISSYSAGAGSPQDTPLRNCRCACHDSESRATMRLRLLATPRREWAVRHHRQRVGRVLVRGPRPAVGLFASRHPRPGRG